MGINPEALRRFVENDYKHIESWQRSADSHDIALEYVRLHVPTVTKCMQCGKTVEENKNKYCGNGCDKDNPHRWKRFIKENEVPNERTQTV